MTAIFSDEPSEAALIARLNKDVRSAAKGLTREEARGLVSLYYAFQKHRITASNQQSAAVRNGEGTDAGGAVVGWFADQMHQIEKRMVSVLNLYTDTLIPARWAKAQKGIGPILSAGLVSMIDIDKAPTVGHIYSFAGIAGDSQKKWEKGKKRPWNAELKRLCWLIGESFVKVSGYEDAVYGQIFAERKAWEAERNERGEYADAAAAQLQKFNYGKDTKARSFYEDGKLPPGHPHARAKRYAAKMFLSDFHAVWLESEGLPVPDPYPIIHLGHAHQRTVPGPTVRELAS